MNKILQNKNCLVTGGNSGIGFATAMKLAELGAYIILLCRNEERAQAARNNIIEKTGNTGIEYVIADLENQFEVREAATWFNTRFEQLDILVNNAGTITGTREITIDGIEKTLAVNYLSHFLLTHLLMDALKTSPQPRIINISSEVHRLGATVYDADNLQLKKGFSPLKAYGVSKLCQVMFTHELARRAGNHNLLAFALHPGTVATRLASEARWWLKWAYTLGRPIMRSPEKGAETPVYLAVSEEVTGENGLYFIDKEATPPSPMAFATPLTERLWEVSEELTDIR